MPVLENFRPLFFLDPTDCPWVSEDVAHAIPQTHSVFYPHRSLLVNLMKDQATKLANISVPAETLSDISEENMRVVERGAFSVVYGSPEAWLKIDWWRKC